MDYKITTCNTIIKCITIMNSIILWTTKITLFIHLFKLKILMKSFSRYKGYDKEKLWNSFYIIMIKYALLNSFAKAIKSAAVKTAGTWRKRNIQNSPPLNLPNKNFQNMPFHYQSIIYPMEKQFFLSHKYFMYIFILLYSPGNIQIKL